MFKLVEKFEGIKDFVLYEGNLVCLSKDGKIPQIPGLDLTELLTDRKYAGDIFIIQHLLFWQDMYGKSLIYDLKNEIELYRYTKDQEIYTFRRIDLTGEDLVVASKKVDGKKQISLFNIKNKTFTPFHYQFGLKARSFEQSKYIVDVSPDSCEIKRISLSGETIWKHVIAGKYFDLRKDEHQKTLRSIMGLYKRNFWITLSSGELIEINGQTGMLNSSSGFDEIIAPNFPYKVERGDYLPFGDLMQLDESKGEIIGLRNKYFMKVDLSRSESRRAYLDVGKSMEAYEIISSYRNDTFPCDDQFIYFCDDRQGKIGVFDRAKKEVVWSYKLEMERDGIAQILDMKYSNNRWYLLDRNDTLHIFEKEQ